MRRIKNLLRRLALVDWSGIILSLLKTLKKEDTSIDPQFLAIKPRVLSDHNLLRGLAGLRVVLSFIPATQIASSVLSLGDTGFKIWKAIALRKDYDQLAIPPLGLNIIRFIILFDPVLKQSFGHLVQEERWEEAEVVCNDLSFITEAKLLSEKYPTLPIEFLEKISARNLQTFGNTVSTIEQEIKKVQHTPGVEANVQDTLVALKEIFPAMRSWAMINSKNFDDIIQIIDEIV